MSTFSGLNAATSALFASQRALDITGQNIANVNTDGYSRQRVDLQSVGGSTVPAIWSTSSQIGQGVNGDSVTRIRDAFLESRAQVEHSTTATMTVTNDTYSQIEDAFQEPGDNGLQAQMATMWSAWGDFTNNATTSDGTGPRAEVLQNTRSVVDALHTVNSTLDQQWSANRDNLSTLVDDVNASAKSIASYNQAIKQATLANLPTNELEDKRDALVLKVSEQIGATSTAGDDGAVTVRLNGATLVQGNSALALKLTGSTSPGDVATSPPQIVTDPGATPITPGGTAAGEMAAMTSIIPSYKAQLDTVAQTLAGQLNTAQTAGFDATGAAGGPLLDDGTGSGSTAVDPSTVTAANIRVRITDGDKLAASGIDPATVGGVTTVDTSNAAKIAQLGLAAGSADTLYRKMIVGLGVQASVATSTLDAQSTISTSVDASRESVSGVSIDEEMTNMLQYQHAYSAAAKVITTIDDTIQTLLNMVGN